MNILYEYYYLFILILLIISFIILRQWRNGIIFIFICIYLEDVIRRIIPGQPPQVMLIKDSLLLITYFAFFVTLVIINNKKPFALWKPPFLTGFLLFGGWCFVGSFNPNIPNPLFPIIGLRSYLWYAPLFFLGYYMFNSEEKVLRFCRILVYTAIPLFIFSIYQYIFFDKANVLIRPFERAHQIHSFHLVETGAVMKISSFFGTGQRYAMFSMFLFFLGMAIYLTSKKNKLLLISTISAFLGVVISGSRAVFALSVVGFILFFMLITSMGRRGKKSVYLYLWKGNRIIRFGLVLFVVLIGILSIYKIGGDIGLFQISAFYFAMEERIPWLIRDISGVLSGLTWLGYGTGTMSQGLQYISGGVDWKYIMPGGSSLESGISKIIFELGIFGFIFFYFFWGHLFFRIKKELKIINHTNLKNIGVSIFVFLICTLIRFSFIHHQVLGDATVLIILWFFIGIIFNLKNLKCTILEE
ncbi:hypothetical protein ES703_10248 [subsurface metagenome]